MRAVTAFVFIINGYNIKCNKKDKIRIPNNITPKVLKIVLSYYNNIIIIIPNNQVFRFAYRNKNGLQNTINSPNPIKTIINLSWILYVISEKDKNN